MVELFFFRVCVCVCVCVCVKLEVIIIIFHGPSKLKKKKSPLFFPINLTLSLSLSLSLSLQEVNISLDGVKQKIGVIVQAKTDSVVLVAVIGTLGGLMVVGLVGVMIYGGVKRKGSKAPTSKPYNKVSGSSSSSIQGRTQIYDASL